MRTKQEVEEKIRYHEKVLWDLDQEGYRDEELDIFAAYHSGFLNALMWLMYRENEEEGS